MDPISEVLSRKQLLHVLAVSDSTERRRRKSDGDWPPHVCIGNKVCYLRSSVDDWLHRQEATYQPDPSQIGRLCAKPSVGGES